MNDEVWPSEWLRGAASTWVLAVLAGGPSHGYAVTQVLTRAGVLGLRAGVLYSVLNRLEQDGLVASTWQEGAGGPGRKVYRLTSSGTRRLALLRRQWGDYAATTADLLADAIPTPVVETPPPMQLVTLDTDQQKGSAR